MMKEKKHLPRARSKNIYHAEGAGAGVAHHALIPLRPSAQRSTAGQNHNQALHQLRRGASQYWWHHDQRGSPVCTRTGPQILRSRFEPMPTGLMSRGIVAAESRKQSEETEEPQETRVVQNWLGRSALDPGESRRRSAGVVIRWTSALPCPALPSDRWSFPERRGSTLGSWGADQTREEISGAWLA
ncbi:hypothetical protein BKA81DRAFT_370403 [Phyllosticta paracitricarpa]